MAMAWRLQFTRRLIAAAAASSHTGPPRPTAHPLFRRLLTAKSVDGAMEAWVREKKPTSQAQLFSFVKDLRRYGYHSPALGLLDWMKGRGMRMTPGVHAIRLDLIAKSKGVQEAQRYFSSLPAEAQTKHTYGALLTGYTHSKMEAQSLSLFAQMQRLNFLDSPLPFNNLMTLFLSLDRPHKIPDLFSQMKAAGISPDDYSYSILAKASALLKDADLFERVVAEVTQNPLLDPDWNLHGTFAMVYTSFGKIQEADSQLKKLEDKMNKSERTPYHFLITLYAGTGNKEEVDRIWKSLRKQFPKTTNGSYLVMLQTLDKLDDINALINWFENWESEAEGGTIRFDIRIPNVVIGAYLKKDMLAEALVVGGKYMAKGDANGKTIDLFLKYFLKNSKMDLALIWFDKGVELGWKGKWKPSEEIINEFVKYFEESMDRGDQYELFREKLKEIGVTEGVQIKESEATAIA